MKSAGNLVGVVVEFTSCVECGHNYFCGTDILFCVNVYRYSSTVVSNGYGFFRVNRHVNSIAMPCQRLINRVIHQLLHHMMQAGAIFGVTNVHTRTLTHRIEAFKHLYTVGVVTFFFAHALSFGLFHR